MTETLPRAAIASAPSRRTLRITQGAGALLIILGLTVLTGWLLRLPPLVQLVRGYVGMVFSTVLCFYRCAMAIKSGQCPHADPAA